VTSPASRPSRPGAARPHFTGRAAILAVVLCGIALSLAYPVREYLAQRRQIDQLLAQKAQISAHLSQLRHDAIRLKSHAYIEEQARDRLLMCLPTQMCYVIINPAAPSARSARAHQAVTPWYGRLWSSVQTAGAQTPAGKARHG
jgi:cell division protein FtsB